jgi:hypothetical protein
MIYKLLKAAFHALPKSIQERIRPQHREDLNTPCGPRHAPVQPGGFSLRPADQLKCIFIHIPKCAGISVARTLFGNLGGGHIPAVDYRELYTPEEFATFFKFTIVRNPWDRLASAFYYLKAGGMNDRDKADAREHLTDFDSFQAFVTTWVSRTNIMKAQHFRPQSYYLSLPGNPLPVDYVGYFENLSSDFNYICKRLGVNADLKRFNKTQVEREDYRRLYTPEMIRIVSEVYADDIQLLGYDFESSTIAQLLAVRDSRLSTGTGC